MADKAKQEPQPKYGYSLDHDDALDLCRTRGTVCPHGCAKDGAPNCYFHVSRGECEPAREVMATGEDQAQRARKAPMLPGME